MFMYKSDVAVVPDATSVLVFGLNPDREGVVNFRAAGPCAAYAGSCPAPFPGFSPRARATSRVFAAGTLWAFPDADPASCRGTDGPGE